MLAVALMWGCLVGLLCSCATTTLKETWKSPEFQGPAVSKIAVIALDERNMLRQGFENRLTADLKKGGATAVTTYDLMSLQDIRADKKAAAEHFIKGGADAVLVLRLANSAISYRDVRPGRERYAGYVTDSYMTGWYNYYEMAFMDMSPTYGSLKQKVYIEAALFDLKTANRIWSGVTETVSTDNTDRVAEMDTIVAKPIAAMRKDGVIP